MKNQKLIKKIIIPAVALLVFFAISLSTMFYALGYFELPYIRRGKEHTTHKMPDIGPAESSIKAANTGDNISSIGLDTDPHQGPIGEDTTGTPVRPTDPGLTIQDAAALSAQGYRVTYDPFDASKMQLGRVIASSDLPKTQDVGNEKTVTEIQELRYEDGGVQFAVPVSKKTPRAAVELYMGYILLDTGAGSCTSLFPSTVSSAITGERKKMYVDRTLTICNSLGKRIGVYPADDVVPAYTRDTQNRALFLYDGQYYYLNEANGDFLPSDYVDARDNRGLYYDYAPDFGTPDNNLKKWGEEMPVTLHYEVDTYLIYARYGVDWRIARELYMLDQKYAELVGSAYARNKYYNATFHGRLEVEKAKLKQEGWKPAETTKTPETTQTPETTPVPETTAVPITSAAITTVPEPTTVPEITTAPEATSAPVTTDAPAETKNPLIPVPVTPSEITTSAIVPPSPAVQEARQLSSAGTAPLGSSATSGGIASSAVESSAVESSAVSSSAETGTSEVTTVSEEPEHIILNLDIINDTYRFSYASTKPVLNSSATQNTTFRISSYIVEQFNWNSQYKYAKAFNFRGGRAVTVDDMGVLRIINTAAGTSVRLDRNYYNTDLQEYVREYYTEPFWKDLRSAGHYYYDNGLLRVRRIESLSYMLNYYHEDEDFLIDTYGNRYTLPTGYHLYAYAEGILILERNGLYGCYHKDGYWVAQPIYTAAEPFVEGLCVLTLSDGTKGMIDTKGTVVLPFRYRTITNASTGVIACYSPEDGWTVLAKMRK